MKHSLRKDAENAIDSLISEIEDLEKKVSELEESNQKLQEDLEEANDRASSAENQIIQIGEF